MIEKIAGAVVALVLAGTCLASVTPSDGTTPTARVVAAQATVHEPWDGLVDVDYTVYLPLSGTTAAIGVTAVDAADATRTFTATTLTGATLVPSSGVYRVTWNVAADYPDTYVEQLRVTVGASVAAFTPDAASGNYLVVDLSAGSSATEYPVSYLVSAPTEGWVDEFKTTKLVMRKLPAGSFTMGTHATDWPNAQDRNLHTVVFTNEVWAGVFEVTQRQWELVTGDRPSYCTNATYYATRPVERVNYNDICGKDTGAQWPATDAVDATSFLGRLRACAQDVRFDLPTEAQWEYACRAGTTTALNNGCNLTNSTQDASLDLVACYGRTTSPSVRSADLEKGTMPVGSYAPNAWGLYDMHGNVWEWTRDWYVATLAETTATNPVGPASSTNKTRVLRGGGWYAASSSVAAVECTSGYRSLAKSPSVSSGSTAYGLRVFATVPQPAVWTGPTTGSGVAEPVAYDGRIIITLPTALDDTSLVVTTGGDNGAVWVATNACVKVGTHAAQCQSPGRASGRHGETTRSVWMETTVSGAGTLSFWWKVDCEYDDDTGAATWDHLAYFVDGNEQARIDGSNDWAQCTVILTDDAVHTIRWEYVKDTYDDEDVAVGDVAWVDGVVWTPAASAEICATIAVDADGNVTIGWTPQASGTYTLLAKRKLDDAAWVEAAESADGQPFTAPAGYWFFKVKMTK